MESYAERERVSVAPGLTCLRAMSGRTDVPGDESVMLDLDSMRIRSPGLDRKILFKTLPAVLCGRGGCSTPRPCASSTGPPHSPGGRTRPQRGGIFGIPVRIPIANKAGRLYL
jgi:hypothetical protein